MSKLFSVSLTTILMLVSLMGPDQPAKFMDDTSPEPNPVVEEAPTVDPLNGDEAIQVEQPTVPDPGDEIVLAAEDPQEITPVELPEENANSPPAEGEEVGKAGAPSGEDSGTVSNEDDSSLVISPNAVDPNPGDCPVGEICDGGGGDDPTLDMVSITFRVLGNSSSGNAVLPNATVTIYQGSNLVLTQATSGQGTVSLEMQANTGYSVSVSATGYTSMVGREIFPFRDATIDLQLQEAPPEVGTITFHVTDAQTGDPLVGAYVRVSQDRTWNHMGTGITSPDGTWTTQELPYGNYSFYVWHTGDYYTSQDIDVAIPVSGTVEVTLERIPESPVSLKVIDAVTGEPVEGAFYSFGRERGGSVVQGHTPVSGEVTTGPIEHGAYKISVWSENHGQVADYRWDHPLSGTLVIQLQPLAEGTVTFELLSDSGEPLANAYVTIFADSSDTENLGAELASGKTNAQGVWTSPPLPGGHYLATIYPDGYVADAFYFSIVSGNQVFTLEMSEWNDVGNLDIVVHDEVTGNRIQGAKVTVRQNGIVAIGHTDKEGFWETPQLHEGTYQITVEKDGYHIVTVSHVRGSVADNGIGIGIQSKKRVNYRIILRFPHCAPCGPTGLLGTTTLGITNGMSPVLAQIEGEMVPVVGARVRLLDPDTGTVVYETTSDENGLVEFLDIWDGDYILTISGTGFAEYSQPITLSDSLEIDLVLEPLASTDPGDGDGEDDNDQPGTGNPGDGSDPDTDNPGDGSDPDTGNPGEETSPDTESPGESTVPDAGDNDEAASGDASDAEATMQSSSSTTDASAAQVSELPNTGAGEAGSNDVAAIITLLIAFTLLSALGVRRRA